MTDLSIGFVSARSVSLDGALFADAGLGRVIDAIGMRCRKLTVALSVANEHFPLHDHRLTVSNADFVPLPWLPSVLGGFHKILPSRQAIREVERRSDVVIVQLPFAAVGALHGAKKPRVYHVCATNYRSSEPRQTIEDPNDGRLWVSPS